MKKRQVAKIQMILGILILLISIFGILVANDQNIKKNQENEKVTQDLYQAFQDIQNKSKELTAIQILKFTNTI